MFKKWPKIPRLENEVYHITEKIDGTNGCIIIQDHKELNLLSTHYPNAESILAIRNDICVYAQSRTRFITPEDDNFGFAKWVKDNAEQLIKDLGVGYHYGEWWGQGIQRGYGLDHKRFSLFNPTKHSEVCYNVPFLTTYEHLPYQGFLTTILKINGSYAAPGYMKPEGLVIYAEQAKCQWKVILDK